MTADLALDLMSRMPDAKNRPGQRAVAGAGRGDLQAHLVGACVAGAAAGADARVAAGGQPAAAAPASAETAPFTRQDQAPGLSAGRWFGSCYVVPMCRSRTVSGGESDGERGSEMMSDSRLDWLGAVRLKGGAMTGSSVLLDAAGRRRSPATLPGCLCGSRGFLSPVGCRRWLLGHHVPARELGVPHGRLTGQWPDPTWFPCFARTSGDRGGRPLYSGDGGAHPDRSRSPASACHIPATCPYAPPQHPSMRGSASRSIEPRVQVLHPADLAGP